MMTDKRKPPKAPLLLLDEQSCTAKPPECAERKPSRIFEAYASFVPVSFVARDWKVSPRRIRALLAAGRLHGQIQPNGYWEVRYPYLFTMGTRGPALKRHRKPEKPLQLVANNPERSTV